MESGSGAKPPDPDSPGFGPGSPGYGPGSQPPQDPSMGGQPAPYAPPAPPAGPEAPRPPAYGGPVPPGGWQQPLAASSPPARPPLAGWGARAGAYAIDALVLLVPAAILFFAIVGGAVGLSGDDDDVAVGAAIGAFILWLILFGIMALLYAPLLMRREGARNGQTWGKQLVGIRAVRDSGEPWGFGSAALREVVLKNLAVGIASSIVPLIPWFLNFFWPLWDDENRALHDMAASSHVVRA